jgi:hypothetical protein
MPEAGRIWGQDKRLSQHASCLVFKQFFTLKELIKIPHFCDFVNGFGQKMAKIT